jgi:cutinase
LTLPTGLLSGSGLGSLLGGTGTGSSPFAIPTGLLSGLGSTAGLSARAGSITENGLDDACKNVTLIFARGTTELGNMGSVVGPSLSSDLKTALSNNVAVQGVDYAADVAGIAEEVSPTGGAGTKSMVADVTKALTKCPDTQIVLSGYSQGAMLVHNTMHTLSSTQAASVKAAVTFGDPFDATEPNNVAKGNFKSFCATGDPVCSLGAASSPSSGGTTSKSTLNHLGYGADASTAATFIQGKVSA